MSEPAQPKKRGRPPKPADERKGHNLTFRTRANLRERLEEAAEKSGRSVTEEVELRVERSFETDRIVRGFNDLSSIFVENGDAARHFASAMMGLIASVQEAKAADGRQIGSQDWSNSPATKAGVRICVSSLLDYYVPKIGDEERAALDAQGRQDLGRVEALSKLWAKMSTGRESEVLDLFMRQNGTST